MTKQKTETNITQPWGLAGTTSVHATKIHTRPPTLVMQNVKLASRKSKDYVKLSNYIMWPSTLMLVLLQARIYIMKVPMWPTFRASKCAFDIVKWAYGTNYESPLCNICQETTKLAFFIRPLVVASHGKTKQGSTVQAFHAHFEHKNRCVQTVKCLRHVRITRRHVTKYSPSSHYLFS